MPNADKVALLSQALHALSVREGTHGQAEKVADLLLQTCQDIAKENPS